MTHRGVALTIASVAGVVVAAVVLWPRPTPGDRPPAGPPGGPAAAGSTPTDAARAPAGPAEGPPSTQAERIIGLRNLLDADRQWHTSFQEEFSRLTAQIEQATRQFGSIDARLRDQRRRAAGPADAATPVRPAEAAAALDRERAAARDALDRSIDRRKAVHRQIRTLSEKIALMEAALGRLMSVDPADAAGDPTGPAPPVDGTPAEASRGPSPPAATPQDAGRPPEPSDPAEEGLVEARTELDARLAEARDAVRRVERLDRGIDVVGRDLESTREMLEAARRDLQDAEEAVRSLQAGGGLGQTAPPAVGPPDLPKLQRMRDEAARRVEQARQEVENQAGRLAESRALQERLRADRAEAARAADGRGSAAEAARALVRFLESPVAPRRLLRWLKGQAPRVLGVAALMLAIWWLARLAGRGIMAGLVRRGRVDSAAERQGRATTLLRVFDNTTGISIAIVGGLAVLDQAGLNISVLLGGAAVIGAAVAFGTQNLVRDYFSGFVMLAENQYSVGHVINLGEVTGTVEDISLRMTVLRDIEGVVHFVPHGQVKRVGNLTHGWSHVVLGIAVGLGEDVDRVMDLLMGLARGLGEEEAFRGQILGDPEMLGVDAMTGLGVVIKFRLKTRPHMRWQVKRELLRRIKIGFDRQGIRAC